MRYNGNYENIFGFFAGGGAMTSDTKTVLVSVISAIVAASGITIGVAKSDNAEIRAEIREIRTEMREMRMELSADIVANTVEIAEMRGALNAHIGGHNHAPEVSPTVAAAE